MSLVSESLKNIQYSGFRDSGSTSLPLWPICQSDHNRTIKAFINKLKLVSLVLHVTYCIIEGKRLKMLSKIIGYTGYDNNFCTVKFCMFKPQDNLFIPFHKMVFY